MGDQTWFRGNIHTHTTESDGDAIRDAGGISCINHPSWKWAFDHEPIIKTHGASLMEVFNAATDCNNYPIPVPGFLTPSQTWDNVLSAGVPIFRAHVMSSNGLQAWTQPVFLS